MTLAFLVLSFVKPATSHAPANLAEVVSTVKLDWFFLTFYPLLDYWNFGVVWGFVTVLVVIFAGLPWMPTMRKVPTAKVNLAECNGCTRCAEDCPTGAVTMQPRTDGMNFDLEATVNDKTCISCGICVGACPTSTPFRRRGNIVSGIELPQLTVADLRRQIEEVTGELQGKARILVFGCGTSAPFNPAEIPNSAKVDIKCVGNLPPPFLDFVLSRNLADGVVIVGCREGNCYHRFGQKWTNARLNRERDPKLRRRVSKERYKVIWAGQQDEELLKEEVAAFARHIGELPPEEVKKPRIASAAGSKKETGNA
jgi:ferredoxin/coenzyme F420-reducing hydrogenase delta subunit